LSQTIQTLASQKTQQVQDAILGKPLLRKEDHRFIIGRSTYVDDIKLPQMLYAAVVRSPYAHAKILKVDCSKALSDPHVRLVLTAKEVSERVLVAMPVIAGTENRKSVNRPVLAYEEANYQGEPIAFIVTDERYSAEDCQELVEVQYKPLPAITDPIEGMCKGSPLVHEVFSNNISNHYTKSHGDVDKIFASADKLVKIDILNQRLSPAPIEPRAVVANYDSGSGSLTVWLGTQQPFEIRTVLADMLRIGENKLRVIAPDVGGAFGAKFSIFAEDVLTSVASMILERPVKWIENRSENFLTMGQGRGQRQRMEAAVRDDGTILGFKATIISDTGAYPTEEAIVEPEITVDMIPAQYDIKCFRAELFCVFTNKVPLDSYRGAGRPEATYAVERMIQRISEELGIDPTEIRLRNFVKKEKFPFKTVSGLEYDSGDYEMNLRKAIELVEYDRWKFEQITARKSDRLIGIGVSSYVEICSFSPELFQTAAITVNKSGKVTVISGTSPHGQGHETPFAQIVADILGIDIDDIVVRYGDTSILPYGTFTAGSRSAALGGSAVLMCANKIKEKMTELAARSLDSSPDSLVFEHGKIYAETNPSKSVSFSKIASDSYQPAKTKDMEPTLFAYSAFAPPNCTYPFGTHIAVVEVEKQTGLVRLLDYVAVDDVGRVLNPMIVDGQVHGGIMQGAGQALLEQVEYGNDGQLLTGSFQDYQIPLSADVLPLRCFRTETPSPSNPLGVKGVGEVGAIGCPPTIVNAVEDALGHLDVQVNLMPLTPSYLYQLIGTPSEKS
jgi:aerobic carbon-monoxide dehydrogenase large subunit